MVANDLFLWIETLAAMLAWVLIVSLLAYRAFAADKRRAERGEWRIPETRLLTWAMIGGWPGAKLAQRRLRHKTRKQPFATMLNLSGIVPVVVAVAVLSTPADARRALAGNAGLAIGAVAVTLGILPDSRPVLPRRFGPGSTGFQARP